MKLTFLGEKLLKLEGSLAQKQGPQLHVDTDIFDVIPL